MNTQRMESAMATSSADRGLGVPAVTTVNVERCVMHQLAAHRAVLLLQLLILLRQHRTLLTTPMITTVILITSHAITP